MKKPLILFAPRFQDWPIELVRSASYKIPDFSFVALVTGGKPTADKVTALTLGLSATIYNLDELEREWISHEPSESERKTVTEYWSGLDLKRIIIGDRNIGHRYVKGGIHPQTALSKACRDDEILERYVNNLCAWVHRCAMQDQFDSVVCYAVAGAPAIALALFCRNTHRNFCRFTASRIGNFSLLDTSYRDEYIPARRRYLNYAKVGAREDEHSDFARKYLYEFRSAPRRPDFAIHNQREMQKKLSFTQILRTGASALARDIKGRFGKRYLRSAFGIGSVVRAVFGPLRAARLLNHWPYQAKRDIAGRAYVYYPLHVDPEASTMVLSPMFTDQLAVIEALSKALPLGMRLVVKEHFPMLGNRPSNFYRELLGFGNTILVSPKENAFELIKEASIVCVITGTTGLEALMLGRPVVAVGATPFEMIGEGLVRCSDFDDLPDALRRAQQTAPASDRKLIAYLAALHSISLDFDLWRQQPEQMTSERRAELVAKMWAAMDCFFEEPVVPSEGNGE